MVIVIGNFPARDKVNLGGQHYRSAAILRLLKAKNIRIYTVDIEKNKYLVPIIYLLSYFLKIIVLPGKRHLKLLSRLVVLNLVKADNVQVVAIGGWYPSFAEQVSIIRRAAGKFNKIYLQLPSMVRAMSNVKNTKCEWLPNFTLDNHDSNCEMHGDARDGYIFLSRVCKDKGVELVFDLAQKNKDLNFHVAGPIEDNYCDRFYSLLQSNKNVTYHGIIEKAEVVKFLSNYKYFLFPTQYPGEGFPGVLLEAYLAGLVSIASNKLYNAEVLRLLGNGVVVDDELKNWIDALVSIKNYEAKHAEGDTFRLGYLKNSTSLGDFCG